MMLLKPLFTLYVAINIADATNLTVPTFHGPYAVGLTVMELTNTRMIDPFAPDKSYRRLMLSAFYPTTVASKCSAEASAYMPPRTAAAYDQIFSDIGIPEGTFEALSLNSCKKTVSPGNSTTRWPIVIFSPGLGNSRLIYSSIAHSLAAQGVVVITVDHPYDALIVEYPDGTVVLATNITTDAQIEQTLAVRTKDISFVIDQLHNHSITRELFFGLPGEIHHESIMVHGHSLGGATAANVAISDPRVRGGINFDGTFYGLLINETLDRPFAIFAHSGKNQSTDSSWAVAWPHLRNAKFQFSVDETTHASYEDFPILVETLGLREQLPANLLDELIGSVNGMRMLQILTVYAHAFIDFTLHRRLSALLTNADKQLQGVALINSSCVLEGGLGMARDICSPIISSS